MDTTSAPGDIGISGVVEAIGGIGSARSKLGLGPSLTGVTIVGIPSLLLEGEGVLKYGSWPTGLGKIFTSASVGVDCKEIARCICMPCDEYS